MIGYQYGDFTVIRHLRAENRYVCRCKCGVEFTLAEVTLRYNYGQKHCRHRLFNGLTRAETAVAQLVSQGKTNKEVAEALVISTRTVQTHLSHIFEKLKISNRTELALVIIKAP